MYLHLKKVVLCLFVITLVQQGYAHSINYALQDAPNHAVIWYYIKMGFTHIIPLGADHILFVAGLCLLSTKLKTILWQATAFTVAHSITLALSMQNIALAPAPIVETIIALSILFVALENMLLSTLKPWRILLVFVFGLIHGMGFASALNEVGLPPGKFYTSVLAFNAGVELGQVAIIIAIFSLLVHPFKHRTWYRQRIVYPLSALIALVALYWSVERMFIV